MKSLPSGPSAGKKGAVTNPVMAAATDDNKFRLVTLAFQRCKQLQNGARPRVEPGDHKSQRIAMLEVLAGAISWSLTDLPVPVRAPA
jgi:DNA-directed RNA polymerase omega subunit